MRLFSRRAAGLIGVLFVLASAGCFHTAQSVKPLYPTGVTANSGGDTRGTVMYHPPASPQTPTDPYEAVSGKFVIGQRQHMAWALAEIHDHAHLQAFHTYPRSRSRPGTATQRPKRKPKRSGRRSSTLICWKNTTPASATSSA